MEGLWGTAHKQLHPVPAEQLVLLARPAIRAS
jgi:hypothetical protein